MGGKQKRAAKYKKWLEAQNLLKQSSSQGDLSSDGIQDGSGDHSSDYQPIPYEEQQEILKNRAKKARKYRNTPWILRKLDNVTTRKFDRWLTWPCTICLGSALFIFVFVLLRNVIQMFVLPDAAGIDRSGLYNSLRMALPRPLYKSIRIIDYLFTSQYISLEAIRNIVYPPDEYYYRNHKN